MWKFRFLGVLCACLTTVSLNVNATILTAIDWGWYTQSGNHTVSNQTAIAGLTSLYDESRSYFLFDLSSLNGVAQSATLQLEIEGYYSDDAYEAATIWDVSLAHLPLLDTTNGSGSGSNIFTDLGTGTAYGSFSVQTPNLYAAAFPSGSNILNINLNSAAIADINAYAGGLFAVGISLDELSLPIPLPIAQVAQEWLRFDSDSGSIRAHSLIVSTIPIPPALYLFGSGLLGLIGIARKEAP